jgi:hypothetical protein
MKFHNQTRKGTIETNSSNSQCAGKFCNSISAINFEDPNVTAETLLNPKDCELFKPFIIRDSVLS